MQSNKTWLCHLSFSLRIFCYKSQELETKLFKDNQTIHHERVRQTDRTNLDLFFRPHYNHFLSAKDVWIKI